MKEETLGESFARVLGPEIDDYEIEQSIPQMSTISEVIEDVINDPSDHNDEYIAACVRAQAALVAVTTANGFYAEAEATTAYAATVARLKRFW